MVRPAPRPDDGSGFSALQRAENSSIVLLDPVIRPPEVVSVLFSEPKIPQYRRCDGGNRRRNAFQCSSASRKFLNDADDPDSVALARVSVLFSEPKIPQFLQAATSIFNPFVFQCSSASRKFLNSPAVTPGPSVDCSFSALQRAENSSI